jgi:hypothetical protein
MTEVLADTPNNDDYEEFIELYNRSDHTIDILDWEIQDEATTDTIENYDEGTYGDITDPDVVTGTTQIPRGAYVVIIDREYTAGVQPFDFPPNTYIVTVDDTTIGDGVEESYLNQIYIKDSAGSIISSWTQCTDTSQGNGNSVQMIDYAAGDTSGNWGEPSGSTPGDTNANYTGGELVITTQYENGWFTSSVFDAGDNNARWNYVDWAENKPAGTDLMVYLRFENSNPATWSTGKPADGSGTPAWQQVTNGQTFSIRARYAQYAIEFTTTDNTLTAELENIRLRFALPLTGPSGTWSQTTWVGGGGQTDWSEDNRFNASENVDWENLAGSLQLQVSGVTLTDNYGNLFRVDTVTTIGNLDNDNDLADIRFTAQANKTITGARFYVSSISGSPTLRVRLAPDDGTGEPNLAGVLADNDNVPVTSTGWVRAGFPATSLTGGNIYHLIISRVPVPEAPTENDFVGAEPMTLPDGSSRVGIIAGGLSHENTWSRDGTYENIAENSLGTETIDNYVDDYDNEKGFVIDFPNMQSAADGGAYAVLVEDNDPTWTQTNWSGENTGEPPYVVNVIGGESSDNYCTGENENVQATGLVRLENQICAGDNLVKNPGFETGDLTNWTEVGTEGKHQVVSTNPHSGTYSVQFVDLTSSYSGRAIRSDAVSVTAGETYTFGAWFYVPTISGGDIGDVRFRCRIEWYNASGGLISSYPGTTGWSLSAFDTWEEREWTDVTAPSDAVTARLFIEAYESVNNNYDPYIDDTRINTPIGTYHESGYLDSSVLDIGAGYRWDKATWNSLTDPGTPTADETPVSSEPDPLADSSARVGEVTGGSYSDTSSQDGVYENISESGPTQSYTKYATSEDPDGFGWNDVANALGSPDDTYAYDVIGQEDLLSLTGYGTETGDITQVVIKAEYKMSAAASNDKLILQYKVSGVLGSTSYSWVPTDTTDTVVSCDVTNDRSWTWTDISNLTIEIKCDAVGKGDDVTVYVDSLYVTITTETNYTLNWEHRISGVTIGRDNYTLKIYGHRDTDEAVDVYIRNFAGDYWELIETLPPTDGLLTKFIDGPSIEDYLSGGAMSIRYFEDTADTDRTTIYLDRVWLEENYIGGTSVEVQVRVSSTDSNPYPEPDPNWSAWQDVDNDVNFNLENRYLQYRVNLSTSDTSVTPEFYDITFTYSAVAVAQYSENITFYILETPTNASSREIQIRYRNDNNNDDFRLQVYDWINGTYENRLTLSSESWENLSYTLTSSENAENGDVRVRIIDLNPSATSATAIYVDYLRVRSTVSLTDNYRLNWAHEITGIATGYDNYKIRIYGYADSDENVGVYIWRTASSEWRFIDNLPTSPGWVENLLLGSGPDNILNYLDGNSLYIRYFENTADSTQTLIYIDYVVCEQSSAVPPTGEVAIRATTPLNGFRPLDNSPDPNANTLWSIDNGNTWTVQDYQPVYVLENSVSPEGNPFARAASYGIYAGNYVGENFTVTGGDKQIVRVGALVRGSTTPDDNLYFAIRDSNNDNLVTGILVESTAAPTTYEWRYVDIPPLTLYDGQSYRFILYSPGSALPDEWLVSALATEAAETIYAAITYDGTNSIVTFSTNGGLSWTDNAQRDIVYNLYPGFQVYETQGYLLSSWYDGGDNSTNWGTITFGFNEPAGTSVEVYVQVENTNTAGWSPTAGPFTVGDGSESVEQTGRYIRYRVELSTTDDTVTPRFDNISIAWSQPGAVGWLTLRVSSPLNENLPYDGRTPGNFDVLYSPDGTNWTAQGYQPIFVLDVDTNASGSVDSHEGNPYDEGAIYSIAGDNYAGVVFTCSGELLENTKLLRGFRLYLRRLGSPPALNYTLKDLTTGENVAVGQTPAVPTSWSWVSVTLENLLFDGHRHRFYLWTTGGNPSNCYQWLAPGRTVDYLSGATDRATFDGTNTYATSSVTAGIGWTDNLRRDPVFQFILAENFYTQGILESSVFDAGDVAVWTSFDVDQTLSGGTVRKWVRTGEDDNPYDGNWTSWQEITGTSMNFTARYIQYKLELESPDGNTTPAVHEVRIGYEPYVAGAVAPAPEALLKAWIQTTREDFMGGREPGKMGENVKVVPPGDIALEALDYWGNRFAGESGFTPRAKINSRTKLFSYRFQPKQQENLVRARLLVQITQEGETIAPGDSPGEWDRDNWIRVRLYPDDGAGKPNMSGSPLATAVGYPDKKWPIEWYLPYPRVGQYRYNVQSQPQESIHVGMEFDTVVTLYPGNTYHLVVDANPATSGFISNENYFIPLAVRPRHDNWINNENVNQNRGVLFSPNNGETWYSSENPASPVYNREPVYVLDVSLDDNDLSIEDYDGNPYYKSADEVFQHNFVGERFVVRKDLDNSYTENGFTAGALEFFMQRARQPRELIVGVSVTGTNLIEFITPTPLDLEDWGWNWARFTFPYPLRLWENEEYVVYAESPASDLQNYPAMNSMKTPWEDVTGWTSTGFGGRDATYVWYSHDVQAWVAKQHREIPFRLVTRFANQGIYVSKVYDASQRADWQFLEWDETRPPGTEVRFYVRVGDSPELTGPWQGPYTGGRADLTNLRNTRYIQYRVELVSDSSGTAAPAVHEVRIGYYSGFGGIYVRPSYTQYQPQRWVFEGGAVILAQNDKSVMISEPDLVEVQDVGGSNIRVNVNYIVVSLPRGMTGRIVVSQNLTVHMPREPYYTVRPADSSTPNVSSVTIRVVTDYVDAWRQYLDRLARRLNAAQGANICYVDAGEALEGVVKLIITGKGEGNDILLYERVKELVVRPSG